jgi:hypothetical protein
MSKSKSKLCYDQRSVGQSVLVSSSHLGLTTRFLLLSAVAGLLMWGALSDVRTGLSFTIAAGPRQRSHSWVRVPRDSWPYFTLSDSRVHQPGGPGPRIYIPQDQGDWVPFSSPLTTRRATPTLCGPCADRTENVSSIIACFLVRETLCPKSCSLATSVVLSPVYTAVTWQWMYVSQYNGIVVALWCIHILVCIALSTEEAVAVCHLRAVILSVGRFTSLSVGRDRVVPVLN